MAAGDRAPAAPRGLGPAGRALWRSIARRFDLDPREAAVLAAACRQADDVARLEAVLERDGLVVPGSQGQPRLSQVVTEVRQARLALARLLAELALPADESAGPGRLSRRAADAARRRWSAV